MLKTRLPLAASLLLCAPLLASAAAPLPLTPEQTLDLYAQVMLEDDAAAARTLNDALRPAFDGQDPIEFNQGSFATALAAPLQGLLKVAGSDAASIEAMPATLAANLGKTRCRAQRSTVRDNASVDGAKVATVEFTCQVTALDGLRPLFDASLEANDPASLKRFMDAYVAAVRSGTRQPLSASIDLYPAKDNGYWYSGNLDKLVAPVVDALLPFEAWQREVAAMDAPTITGVASCDLLLQQHRSCVATIAPEQLNGVAVMADELKAKARVMTPLQMSQECKALRSLAEAMWTDQCD
ncbi:hypothetical protein KQ945_01745 [Bacillus subtilis subsp. subtilis]|nr:hypothetical protein [Bacillus subtilis subsp. subtilis]